MDPMGQLCHQSIHRIVEPQTYFPVEMAVYMTGDLMLYQNNSRWCWIFGGVRLFH